VGAVEVSSTPGATATCVRISPDGRKLYAVVQRPSGDVVMVLDAGLNAVDTIEVGSTIRDVAVSPDGESLFIASYDPDLGEKVELVDTHADVAHTRFAVGALVTRLTVSRDGDRLYVLTADGIVVICTRTDQVVDTIAVAGSPSGAVESADGNHLYVADYEGSVTVVSVAVLAATLSGRFIPDDAVAALLELEPAV
ncbi:MAG TPA: YncE family protein, partial [Mycobacterium sp.]|nr:YncE family protein [Mycobacterium sp.]